MLLASQPFAPLRYIVLRVPAERCGRGAHPESQSEREPPRGVVLLGPGAWVIHGNASSGLDRRLTRPRFHDDEPHGQANSSHADRSRGLLLFVFNLVDQAPQSACAQLVYVVAEIVLVDAVAQSDGFVQTVDFHCATPRGGATKHLGDLAGAGMQVVRSAIIKGSSHTVAARSGSASDASANIGMAQQLSGSFRRHRGSEPR